MGRVNKIISCKRGAAFCYSRLVSKRPVKTSTAAPRQIAPPPLGQHLREFASNPHAWLVLARNLIPVVGIYAFGWSAGLAVFNYWFDGLAALGAILAALVPRALRESAPPSREATAGQEEKRSNWLLNIVRGVFVWLV